MRFWSIDINFGKHGEVSFVLLLHIIFNTVARFRLLAVEKLITWESKDFKALLMQLRVHSYQVPVVLAC